MSIGDRRVGFMAARSSRQWAVLPLAAGMTLLVGCASAPPLQAGIKVVPDERMEVFWVRAYPGKEGVLVTGQVRRTGMSKPALGGHLHVTAEMEDRHQPASVDTRWTGSLSGRVRRSARFSVLVPAVPADRLRSIRVEYRAGRDAAPKGKAATDSPSVPVAGGSHDRI